MEKYTGIILSSLLTGTFLFFVITICKHDYRPGVQESLEKKLLTRNVIVVK